MTHHLVPGDAPDWTDDELVLVDRFLAGDCAPDEACQAEALLAGDAGSAARYGTLIATLRAEGGVAPDEHMLWTAFRTRTAPQGHASTARPRPRPRSGPRHAAALGAGVAFALAAIAVTALRHRPAATPPATTYATATGQRAVLTLDDGATATLAPQTTLTLDASGRMAALTGEALFTVPHAARTPFVVRTGGVTTRVLGTEFGVRRYPGDAETRVVVVSGRVAAGAAGAPVTLDAGTIARVSDDSVLAVSRTSDARSSTTWAAGHLVFEDAPVTTVLAAVERWSGFRFRLADSTIATRSVSTELDVSNRTEMMAALESLLDVTMTFDGPVVTLAPRRAVPRRTPVSPARRTNRVPPQTEMGR